MKNSSFLFFSLFVIVAAMPDVLASDSGKEKFFPVYTTERESTISLDLKKVLGLTGSPKKVQADCTCVDLKLVEKETGLFLEFTLKWKDSLMIPVLFAFTFPDGKVESKRTCFVKMTHAEKEKPTDP